MTLRLIDLEAPLDDVEFPNGAKHTPVPFGAAEYKLWREIGQEPDAAKRGGMLLQIVRACYPTATAEDWDTCTPKMLIAMAAHAGRKIDQIRDALKNVEAAAAMPSPPPPTGTSPTPPSSPRTSGATSASSSRRRSAKTSGTPIGASPTASPT